MTTTKRLYFEPSDILAIQLECKNCNTSVRFAVKGWKPEARTCPRCEGVLIDDPTTNTKAVDILRGLVESLSKLSDAEYSKRFEFRLCFELESQV